MTGRGAHRLFSFRSIQAMGAALLLLIAGALATAYQFHSARIEHRRQLVVQARVLAASVTAAIAFNDRSTAQEYVNALLLDPRLNAVTVFNEANQRVAGFQRSGSKPIADSLATDGRLPDNQLLVEVPARQGTTQVGRVYLRAAKAPLMVQLARYSGILLLTAMAVLMLSALAVAQRALTRANAALQRRAGELADTNARLTAEMEQRASTEEALRQSQKMEAIGQLSGGVAHDFNNLLMIIKSSLAMLQMKLRQNDAAVQSVARVARECIIADANQDTARLLPMLKQGLDLIEQREARYIQVERYLEVAHGGIESAASLTQRLLSFARRQPLSPTSLNLDSLIEGIRPLLEHSTGSSVRIDYSLNSQWLVLCDANQMENAILNLVINARDAMPEGGQITIATDDVRIDATQSLAPLGEGDHVRLRVKDTGTGMSEEVRRKAFDPFFTTKPVGKGTGLGLSTILGYVMQSNGNASIDSEPGRGTTINLFFPRTDCDKTSDEVA